MSRSFERIFGRASEEFVEPESLLDWVHPEDRVRVAKALTQAPDADLEYRIVRPDGTTRWLRSRDSIVRSEGGHPERIVSLSEDITERKSTEDLLQGQRRLLSNLLSVARATMERTTLDATLRDTLSVAKLLTSAREARLFLLSEAAPIRLIADTETEARLEGQDMAQLMDQGLEGWVVRNRRPAVVFDQSSDPKGKSMGASGSALSLPIANGPNLVGVLTLVHEHTGHFGQQHVDLMGSAGEQIVLALQSAELLQVRARISSRQTILYEVLRVASGDFDPAHISQTAADAIARWTGWLNVVISIPGESGYWALHPTSTDHTRLTHQKIDSGVVGRAHRTGMTQLVQDVKADPDYLEGSPVIRSELAVPLKYKGHRLGVLNVEAAQLHAFDPDDVRLAESVAEVVALALENARLFQEVAGERGRLEAVIQASRDGILLLSSQDRILVVNDRASQLLRCQDMRPSLVGAPFARMLLSIPPGPADTLLKDSRRRDADVGSGQIELPWAALGYVSVPAPSVGRLLILRDITEERKLERMREDLTRTMVHDLRSPLTSAMGFLNFLEQEPHSLPGRSDMLQVAKRGMLRSLALIDGILDLDRFEAGALPLNRRPLDLRSVVSDVAELMRPLFQTAEVPLETRYPDGELRVSADPEILTRVLQNLLENALKFSPRGTPVTVSVENAGPEMAQVSVSDQGPGIAPELRSRLFQKFARGREPHQGSGLGLAFCRLAIDAHGGQIRASENVEKGALLVFRLPALPAASS